MNTPVVLALDIGGTKIAGGFISCDANAAVMGVQSTPTDAARGGHAVLQTIIDFAQTLLADAPGEVAAIGVASAGVVDAQSGWITSATQTMPGWGGTPLGPAIQQATGCATYVLGDVWAHALGEYVVGAGSPYSSCLVIAIGTGIGGAMVEEGKIHKGAHNVGGHIGHIPHHLAQGRPCSCGRVGHIEPIASGSGIEAEYCRLGGQAESARYIDELANQGDPVAEAVISHAGRAMGEIIGGIANVYDPEAVILSGSVTRSGDLWWHHLRQGFSAQAMDPLQDIPLVLGSLGGNAPLLGAAFHTGYLAPPS